MNTLMGWGTDLNRCISCQTIKAVGDMGICRDCVLKKVKEEELVCKDCLIDRHQWMPDGRDERTCISCGEYKILDEDHLCRNCFDTRQLRLSRTPQVRRCWKCQNKFLTKDQEDHFCDSCKPRCFGCKRTFNPERKDDIFCDDCLDNLASHSCTLCEEDTQVVNERGHCQKCQNKKDYPYVNDLVHYCNVCGINEVTRRDGICNYCTPRVKKCPVCLEKNISVVEFVCDNCKDE